MHHHPRLTFLQLAGATVALLIAFFTVHICGVWALPFLASFCAVYVVRQRVAWHVEREREDAARAAHIAQMERELSM